MTTKIYIILILCFGLLKTFAQSYEEQYLQEEQLRLNQVQIIENEIQAFINQNINTYDFTEVTNNVNNMKDEDGNSLSGNAYQDALQQAKKQKLRDVFFQQNPEKTKYFYATTLKQQCINGGFESNGGSTTGYSFAYRNYTHASWQSFGNFPFLSSANVINPPHTYASLVTASPDPNIPTISRVFTGNSAIRLNQTQLNVYSRSVSSMRRQFTVNEDFISYAYALFFQNPTDGGHEEDTRFPYYQVRLYSANNQVLFQKNINTGSSGFMYSPNNNILYTGWTCEKINTHEFLGQVVTLEITLSNCGNSGHIGYGYFDDFCGLSSNCIPQSVASINLHPLKETHCPSFPINVNGNYTIPIGATFNGIELDILEAGTGTLINTISVTNSLTSTNFNFLVNYNDFYPNVVITNVLFNFRVRLLYTIGGFTQSIAANNTNPPGPDISFRNCPQTCPEEWYFTPNQPIQTSTNFQASCCITSESVINPNINVDFRAGYEIVLKPNPNGTAGFYATGHQSGNFHAYIARCDEINKLPEARSKQSKIIAENTSNKPDIKIHPNPASTYINIDSRKEKITSWELFDVSGKSILKGTSNQVNVQNLPRTTYLLEINTTSKQVTKKVIVK